MNNMNIVLIIVFCCFLPVSQQARRRIIRKADTGFQSRSYSSKVWDASKVHGNLAESSTFLSRSHAVGLLTITYEHDRPHLICFPEGTIAYKQVLYLSHALCRQMGFMSMRNIQVKALDSHDNVTVPRLSYNSWRCDGHEQSLTQCRWDTVEEQNCTMVTEVSCGKCEETLSATEGFISSPGYPLVHLYDLTCEWHIESPSDHTIHLMFSHDSNARLDPAAFHCSVDKPYVEVVSYIGDHSSVNTICDFRKLKNMTLPNHRVRIRYFSGLYNSEVFHSVNRSSTGGMAVGFRATSRHQRENASSNLWWKFVQFLIVMGTLCFIGGLVFCLRNLFYKRSNTRQVPSPPLKSNAPDREELEQAYTFQRCCIPDQKLKPGLRLRSNNSAKSSVPSAIYNSASGNLSAIGRAIGKLSTGNTPRSLQSMQKMKTKLMDRFSRGSSANYSDSSVFLTMDEEEKLDFGFYHSDSRDCESPEDVVFKATAV